MFMTLAQAATSVTSENSGVVALFERVLHPENFPLVMIFGVGGVIAVVAITLTNLRGILIGRAQERTRQEIAAYVAEGSISASEGERLLANGDETSCRSGTT